MSKVKNSDFMFFNKIEARHLNNDYKKIEINVARTFRDIVVRFGIEFNVNGRIYAWYRW